jgi:uncharacterized protein (DUF58 family)
LTVESRGASFHSRLRRRLEWPRRLEFTREGKYFVGLTIGVGLAATSTGHNLLYLVLGMLLSMIVASGVMSEVVLRGLKVHRQLPRQLFAGRAVLISVTLENSKRRLPSFSIEIEDLIAGRLLDRKCYFLKVPPGRTQTTSYQHRFARRGRYCFTGFRISTKFPFALFRKSLRIEALAEVIVFPEYDPVLLPPVLPVRLGDVPQASRGRRGEFFSFRRFRQGEDPHDIDFKASARSGQILIREHQEERDRRIAIFVDNGLPEGDATTDEVLLERLERTIREAASFGAAYLEKGYALLLVTRGQTSWLRGPAGVASLFRLLALLPTMRFNEPFPLPSFANSLLLAPKSTDLDPRRPSFLIEI